MDPFQTLKDRELLGPEGGLSFGSGILRKLAGIGSAGKAAAFLLHSSLWGNRVDLSNYDVEKDDRERLFGSDAAHLLVDHTPAAVKALLAGRAFDVIMDNAGPELVSDLLLSDFILGLRGESCVRLHVKRSPFFVSDTMVKDVQSTLTALRGDSDPALAAAGTRLLAEKERGRLTVADHYFWNGPLHFSGLPEEITSRFADSDLLILKGDANYRRLLEDRKWDPWTRMEDAACRLPAPLVALRTMKSEIVVDIPREKAEGLSRTDPEWLIDGKRGIVRMCRT
jgi:hypothetical protein